MWRNQLETFWDGKRLLALGLPQSEEGPAAIAPRSDLIVIHADDPDFAGPSDLLDVIEPTRWRAGCCFVALPHRPRFVALRGEVGPALTLAFVDEKKAEGEQRLLLSLLPESTGAQFSPPRVCAIAAQGDPERMIRERIAQFGPRLLWASVGLSRDEDQSGAAKRSIAPSRRVFPASRSRLSLEPVEIAASVGDSQSAPFAILDCWLREGGAPRVVLRLRLPDSIDESAALLSRSFVTLVMQQRRRLKEWERSQREAGDPSIDALSFEDLRVALKDPAEHPDAVESGEAILLVNLHKLLTAPQEVDADGLAARRVPESGGPGAGAAFDIEFYGATLGDDVGLVSLDANPGDVAAAPLDPGGAPTARLFRVEPEGLRARRCAEDDAMLQELLRRAAHLEGARGGAAARATLERAAGLFRRRETLVSALNASLAATGSPERLEAGSAWSLFEPLLLSSYVALIEDASPRARMALRRLGGFAAYRGDPSLVAALAARADAFDAAPQLSARTDESALPQRFLESLGLEGLTPRASDSQTQLRLYRAVVAQDAEPLIHARVALSGEAEMDREAATIAQALLDEAPIERAAARFEAASRLEEADRLRDYLAARRAGRWSSVGAAATVAALLEQTRRDSRRELLAAEQAKAEAEAQTERDRASVAEPPRQKSFFAGLRGMFRP